MNRSFLITRALLIAAVFASGKLLAAPMPDLPSSERILTLENVRSYWINTLQARPIPTKPLGLHPERQSEWQRKLNQRNALIESLRRGDYDTDANLAALRHNAAVWRQQGKLAEAEAADARIREINEHLSRMATLEMQRRAAQSQIDSAQRLKEMAAALSELNSSSCNQ
jgi:hypothetical protein